MPKTPSQKLHLLLLQHLNTFQTPFYQNDVYLTFQHVVKDQIKFFELFSFFLKQGYICQSTRLSQNCKAELVASSASCLYSLSITGINQLRSLLAIRNAN